MPEIDSSNRFLVGLTGAGAIQIMLPPRAPISKEDAINLAAWLLAIADPGREQFERTWKAVMSS